MSDDKPSLGVKGQALKSVARGAGIFFVGIIIGRFLGYLIRMVIARLLGPESYGIISLGLAVVEITATLALVGLPTAIGRYVPFYWSKGEKDKVRGTIRASLYLSIPIAIVMATVLFFSSDYVANHFFNEPALAPILKIFTIIVPFYGLMLIFSSIFAGFKKMEYIVYTQQLIRYVIILLVFVTLYFAGAGIKAATYAYPLGYFITIVIAWRLTQKIFPIFGSQLESTENFKQLLSFSWPLILVSMIWFIIDRVATLMLGYFQPAATVGIYNAALPLAQLIPAVLQSFTTIFMPIVASILSKGDMRELKSIYATTTKWIFTLTLPLFVLIFFFSEQLVVTLFGIEYIAASPVLKILALGFLIHAAVGPTTMTLNVLERTKLNLFNTISAFVANLLLHYFLIPRYGIIGAAIASAAALLVLNALCVAELFFLYGILPFNKSYVKTIGAGVFATVATFYIFDNFLIVLNLWTLLVLTVSFSLIYIVLIIVSKSVEHEDVAILKEISKKFGINIKLPEFIKTKFL